MKIFIKIFTVLLFFSFGACKKSSTDTIENKTIVGKWRLVKSCGCNTCMEYNTSHTQVLEFLQNGQLKISEQFGDPLRYCNATYTINQQPSGNILSVSLDSTCGISFPIDSLINTQTTTTLILAEPGAPCASQDTYTATR